MVCWYESSDSRWLVLPALARGILTSLYLWAEEDGGLPACEDEPTHEYVPRLLAAHRDERDTVARLTCELIKTGYLRREPGRLFVKLPANEEATRAATATERQARYRARYPRHAHIYERDGRACRYCGAKEDLEIDHVIPRAQGGRDTEDNLVVACAACNGRKGNRTPEQAGMALLPIGGE